MTNRRKFLKKMAAFSTLSLGSCGWRLANVGANYTSSNQSDQLYIYTWTQYTDKELLTNLYYPNWNESPSRCL